MNKSGLAVTIVLPAKNEAESLSTLLPELRSTLPDAEIIVVDDGSEDDTASICSSQDVRCIRHQYSLGNGAAIKSGARAASGDVIVFMDADGQHSPTDVPRLLECIEEGYDMVVGARGSESQASTGRGLANRFYNRVSSWVVGHKIEDLTSGFRAVRTKNSKNSCIYCPTAFPIQQRSL